MPAVTGLNFQAETLLKIPSVDLSIINMTSGWCEKAVSLTHRTWNVRVNHKTGKKALVPDGTSEHRESIHCKQVFRDTHLDANFYLYACVRRILNHRLSISFEYKESRFCSLLTASTPDIRNTLEKKMLFLFTYSFCSVVCLTVLCSSQM